MTGVLTRRRLLGTAAVAGLGIAARVPTRAEEKPEGKPRAPAQDRTVVDSHVHLKHGDAARTEYSPEVIVRTMDEAGIQKSVVFAMSTTTQRSIEMAEAAVQRYPDRLIPYVYALPSYERPVLREIEEAVAERGFRGIKIHVGECTLAQYVIDPVLKLAGKRGVPCLIDLGGRHADAQRIVQAFPETTIIIAHMGRYLCTDSRLIDQFLSLAEKHGNCFLDVSGVVLVLKVEEAVRRIGSHRLLWGSDGPHPQPDTATFARRELDKIRQLNLTESEKANILGQNVLKLLMGNGKSAGPP